MMIQNASGRRNGLRSHSGRRLAPAIEAFERRQLLTGGIGYIAGTVYLDSNGSGAFNDTNAYLPGARIDLSIAGQQGILASTTTDANGGYTFRGLDPGNYILTETPPSSDHAIDSQVLSQLYPASKLSSNSIAVTVVDPTSVYATNNGINNNLSLLINDTLFSRSASDNAGPLNFGFGTAPGADNLDHSGTGVITFCLDDLSSLSINGGESFRVIPTDITSLTNGANGIVPASAAGRIAYLYNHFGNTALTNITGPALQVAIWELIYDTPGDYSLTNGTYKLDGPINASDQARFDAVVQQADAYIALSAGKSENAMFLDAATPAKTEKPPFSQSILTSSSFDFLNGPGARPISSLSGFVYVDQNNDGVKQAGEPPIPGTTVTLTGTDTSGNSVNLTTTTDSTGLYSFNSLNPGTYTIQETQPTGYLDGKDTQGTPGTGTAGNDIFSNITLGANVNGTDNNFGELLPSSLAGFVYVDANNNGIKESSEAPIPGTTITLTGTDDLGGSVTQTTTTDNTGAYLFGNLRPGLYTITETQPASYLDGKDTQGTPGSGTTGNDVFSNITLAQNVNGTDNNFGELLPSSLAGFVYVDANNNGIKEPSEAPIPGTTITLTGTDDLGGSVTQTTTTDNTGAYSFGNLRPGLYTITETQPTGYLDGKDTQGTPGTGTTGNDVFSNITLAQNVNGVNNNFGELLPTPLSSLAGFVYVDANNNGIKESGETPISGVTITLTGTGTDGSHVTETTTTDGTGAYFFGSLQPGTYTIQETQPAGYLDGKDTQGTPGTGTAGNDVFSTITLAGNVNGTDNNFGELLPSSLAGFVYVDANNNGIKEPSEAPIPGTTITLTGTDDLGGSVTQTATTDNSGAYSFGNLRPGVYTITETQPAGFLDGQDTQGTPGTGTTGNDVFSNITLAQNVNGVNNNFGELLSPSLSSLSGFVYHDLNDDGIKEPGEPPIPGTTVTLTGTTSQGTPVTLTTTTDNAGAYSFANLQAGSYTIQELQPAGYLDGKDTQGTPGTGTTGNDIFSDITLAANVNGTDNNFGELLPSSLAGFVYVDANNNGIKEPGEAPIPGTTITLTGTNDLGIAISQTTQTDGGGAYSFGNLRPGVYTITETQPAGFVDGKDTQGTPGTGITGNDVFSNITLVQSVNGVNNNFGELTTGLGPDHLGNPPTVISVVLNGIHHQQSTIIVSFDGAVDPAVASNPANYQLIGLGQDQRLFTRDDYNVPIDEVTYDPNTKQATIIPAFHINFHYHYLLTINLPATSSESALNYSEIIGRSSMTFWDYHGEIITPPAMSPRQVAADQAVRNLAYQQLALRSSSVTPRPREIRTMVVQEGKATILTRSLKQLRTSMARTPHVLVVGHGRKIRLK